MSELLIVLFLLLISGAMFSLIVLILKADQKVIGLNYKVTKFKETDFSQLQKVVQIFNTINKNINLGKIKHYFEIVMTAISAINTFIIFRQIYKWLNKNKSEL